MKSINSNKKSETPIDKKIILSTLWIFLMFNYLYCDVISNMESAILKALLTGQIGSIHITQGFLLGTGILMEIPIAMVVLSRLLNYRANRWANIIAGVILTVVQLSSFFIGTAPSLHYIFFSIIEISCNLFIAWYAWKWKSN